MWYNAHSHNESYWVFFVCFPSEVWVSVSAALEFFCSPNCFSCFRQKSSFSRVLKSPRSTQICTLFGIELEFKLL